MGDKKHKSKMMRTLTAIAAAVVKNPLGYNVWGENKLRISGSPAVGTDVKIQVRLDGDESNWTDLSGATITGSGSYQTATGDISDWDYVRLVCTAHAADADIVLSSFFSSASGGSSTFTGLTDTPGSYSGEALKVARVNAGETAIEFATVAGTGDVVGPASATDNAVVRYDSTTGKLIQDSSVIIDDTNNVTGVNNLTVTGDLTVNGTTTTINTTNLDVTDKNITLNDTGSDASSEGAGITVERTGTDGSIVYEDALTSKFKLGALGSEVEIADVSSAQTITNKTINADNNTVTNIGIAELDTNMTDYVKLGSGATLDTVDITVSSDGATVTLTAEKSGGGDVRIVFSTGIAVWDCTPAATISLTAGSDTSPTLNYIYVLESTGVLTLSTTGFPGTEYAPVATVLCQSATGVQTDGAYKVHAWTDHMSTNGNNGHLAHINSWIRNQPATWKSGTDLTPTITTNGGAADNVDVAITSGVVLQLHDHAMPALDTGVADDIHIINHNTTPYVTVTDLNTQLTDSTGGSMSARYFNLVLWGVVSEKTSDCHLMCNLPSGSYTKLSDAQADTSDFTDFSIPTDFLGVGFLIKKLTFRHQTASGGTWTLADSVDLRGSVPGAGAAGSSSTVTEFSDNVFDIFNVADNTKLMEFDVSGITTATTRTISMADANIDLADIVLNNTHRTSNGSSHTFINQDVTSTGTPTFADITVSGYINQSLGNSVIVGTSAGPSDDATNNQNVYIGVNAANISTTSQKQVVIGYNAGLALTTCQNANVFIGHEAGKAMINNGNCVFIGGNAGVKAYGSQSVAIGVDALHALTVSGNNTAVGYKAAYWATGVGNTCVGISAGNDISAGTYNTCIGYNGGYATNGGDRNIAIGYLAEIPTPAGDDQLSIGNTIYGDLANDRIGIGVMPTANMDGLAIEGGLLTLKETTTPTADTNYGKIYTKIDNKLYFQDGAGTEHEIAFV